MKKILLTVIFFLICVILFFIYNHFNSNNLNILYIGDYNIYYHYLYNNSKYNIDRYTYDNITYKEIKNDIINNSYKIIKNKNIYLNQLISKSDIIILNANNFKYSKKCYKSSKIIDEYNNILFREINDLISLINKFSNSKIYIIGNQCKNGNYAQNFEFVENYFISFDNIENIFNFIEKTAYYN